MLTLADIEAARDRITGHVHHTPLDHSTTFSEMTGASVRLKLETFQRTGSFKIRGATNRIMTLSPEEQAAGVITASAGNHAQGVALAAKGIGVDATIVMPEHAPIAKVNATRGYGATVVLHGIDYTEAAEKAAEIAASEGRTYVHAFNDPVVMAGQGTIGLEIMADCPTVDTVVVPIGGGGLISGIATAVKGIDPSVRVVGVQAEGAASVPQSLERGEIFERESVDTIADGIATRRVGDACFEIIKERVDEVVTVSDSETASALLYVLERGKTLVEGAGAVPLAAVLAERFDYESDEVIVPALCGGNIDLTVLTTVILRGLAETGRHVTIRTVLKDRPGALVHLATIIADHGANITAIHHDRTSGDIAMNAAEVEIDLETRGHEHAQTLIGALKSADYTVEILD